MNANDDKTKRSASQTLTLLVAAEQPGLGQLRAWLGHCCYLWFCSVHWVPYAALQFFLDFTDIQPAQHHSRRLSKLGIQVMTRWHGHCCPSDVAAEKTAKRLVNLCGTGGISGARKGATFGTNQLQEAQHFVERKITSCSWTATFSALTL